MTSNRLIAAIPSLAILLATYWAVPAGAQGALPSNEPDASMEAIPLPTAQIEIRHAAEAEYFGQEHKILLTGAVHIIRATMSIRADRVEIQLNDGETEVITATAQGRVVIVDGERRAKADRALYVRETSEIILTGSPRLHDGLNEIAADKIVYGLADRSMRATGGVRGILVPTSRK